MINAEHFYQLVEHSLDGVVLATENGNILYANQALCSLVQRSKEEVIQGGRNILFNAGDTRVQEAVRMRDEIGFGRTELDLADSLGNMIPVEVSSVAYTDASGKRFYATFFRDLRERKIMEKELTESRERFRILSDSAFEGIVININGQIVEANSTMSKMFGYQDNEMLGLTAEALVTEDCVPLVRKNIQQNYQHPYKVKGKRKSGEVFPVEVCGSSTIYKGQKARITSFRDITEKLSTEKELKRYETKFQTLFANGSDMLALLNEKAEYIYIAPSVERILGYKPEQLIGESAFMFIHPDDTGFVLAKLDEAFTTKTVTIPDFRFKHANGNYIWIETVLDNMLGNKHVKAISASSRDITTRKLAEFALKQREADLQTALQEIKINEQKFRSLFDQNPNAVFSIDNEGQITSANNAFTSIMQLPREEVLGRHVLAFFHLEDDKDIRNKLNEALHGVADTFFTQFINRKDQFVKATVTILPIVIDDKITGAYCVARDVTEAWQNEQRMRATKQMLQKVAENESLKPVLKIFLTEIEQIYATFRCTIVLLKKNRLYHYVSPGVEEEYSSEIDGMQIPEPDKEKILLPALVANIYEETDLGIFKEILVRKSIEAFIAYPIISATGSITGFLALTYKNKDQFYEKHIEVASQLTKLVGLVMDNKNSLENIKRQNAQLQKMNSELDRFAYSTSHELRAPLTSIKGLVTLAKSEDICPAEIKEYLELIEKSTVKLENFILEIGDYYRNKNAGISCEPVHLHRLLSQAIESLQQHQEDAADVEFDLNVDPGLCFYSDTERIDIIMTNLIQNAVKYSDASKPARFVYISAAQQDGHVQVTIEDNGIGIAEACLPKIGNMFYRAAEESRGSGLGLYIVKEVVSTLKGEIEIQSKIGRGTSIILQLPANMAPGR